MEQEKTTFGGAVRNAAAALRRMAAPAFWFEAVYRAGTTLVAKPLLAFLMQLMLRLEGSELAFNDGIWRFALTIPGVLSVLLLGGVAVLCTFFEFVVVIDLAKQALQGHTPRIRAAVVRSIWSFQCLRGPGAALFALYALGLLPLVNMGVTSSLLPQLSIPNFITGELTKTPVGIWLLLLAGVLLVVLFFCLLFLLPAMVLDHTRFGTAVKSALRALRAYRFACWGLRWFLPRAGWCCFWGRGRFSTFSSAPPASAWARRFRTMAFRCIRR